MITKTIVQTETIVQYVDKVKEVEVPVYFYIDRPTIKTVVEVNLKDWESYSILQDFISSDNTSGILYVVESFDCDDYAYTLRARAAVIGYYLSTVPVSPQEYYKIFGTALDSKYDYHMMNMARVNNRIYLVEPQTDQIFDYGLIDLP